MVSLGSGRFQVETMVILLAEDDVGVQFFIWKLLKTDGYTVLTAGDGEAGLEASRNHPGPIDLLLTDFGDAPDGRPGALQTYCVGTPRDQGPDDVGCSCGEENGSQ